MLQVYPKRNVYDAVIVVVAHAEFRDMGIEQIRAFTKSGDGLLFDIKGIVPAELTNFRL
jgi:UDP-N-acetyl-D-glucosamine/UDP-N-acetyl-D-galactosamine dehydrogenase